MAHHSPRPSLDAHSHGSTPFFHTLTQRLRKSSNASSYGADPSSPSPTDPTSRTEATRAARRMVLSMVQDDWEWPPPPPPSPSPSPSTPVNNGGRSPVPHREPLTYRLREEAQSDLEIDDFASKRRSKSDPYKFESPEAVGTVIAERRRKRRKMQEEEMSWNEGLKTWIERRDAWTGALQQKPSSNRPTERRPSSTTKRHSYKSRLSQVFTGHRDQPTSTDGGSTSWPVSPASPTPECSSLDSVEAASAATRISTNTTAEPLSPSATSQPPGPASPSAASPSTEPGPWIPIYPPILPQDNIIRDRIKPSAYPTIYSKIVVQGLTPNVPIPLCHMIPALVEGWKSEGNWPPQPSATLAQDVKKGRKSSTFAKWRKEQFEDQQNGQDPSHLHRHHFYHHATGEVAAAVVSGGPKDFPNAHEEGARGHRVRRSIGMMRRVGSLLGGSLSSDGLDELGIEFREQDEEEMGRNVALNKGLVH